MVEGFNADVTTLKPYCEACITTKQHTEPYPKSLTQRTMAGDLTHIDLLEKYTIKYINGNQYYLLFVDDVTRYITIQFLREKSDMVQKVSSYLAYMDTHEKKLKAIQIDHSTKFVNEMLNTYCTTHGIEIRLTAPYSPLQNGIAERMNTTLVELSRAMLSASKLPEYLWEPTALHAAYLQNRSYTRHLHTLTPYDAWNGKRLDVSHLREFGAPVWILLQGKHKDRKMLPKSQRGAYIRYDDGAHAVKYYNTESRTILTSQNFRIVQPVSPEPPEQLCKGKTL
jgi:hypothetical protein